MNSEEAGNVLTPLRKYILIANWFDKEWFENTYDIKLTEIEYLEIVDLWNDSSMCDDITTAVKEWIMFDKVLEGIKN